MTSTEEPIFPEVFSTLEQCQLLVLLEEASASTRIYRGDYTAPWLISPIHAPEWIISKGEETRYIDNNIRDHYTYKWSTKLYDGTNLISQENNKLLREMQRLAFLIRELPGGPKKLLTFKSFLWSLNFLVRWMFVHGNGLNPRRYSLTQITQHHLIDFFIDLSKGGTVFALRYPERFLQAVAPSALGRAPSREELEEPLNLHIETCLQVSLWLKKNKLMKKKDRSSNGELELDPNSFCQLINVDGGTVSGGPKWHAFLHQFDFNENNSNNSKTLVSGASSCRREMPTQRLLTNEEVKNSLMSEKSLSKYFSDIKYILGIYRHLPNICPNPINIKPKEISQTISNITSIAKHTPWIPLPTAMAYTTEALRWVHVYGEDLVSFFLKAYEELYENGLLISAPTPDKENPTKADLALLYKKLTKQRDEIIDNISLPASIRSLNIKGMGCYGSINGKRAFKKLRDSPSLMDAIMVLIGAISVVVTMTKPMRESEFRSLKRDCLHHVKDDGYWLMQEVKKKSLEGSLSRDARPIPVISATAIQLLRTLTDGIKKIVGITDPWLISSLMTLPSFGLFEPGISVPNSSRFIQILDAFCDYVAISPDSQGRRWYLRIHEMRKSFLITFFWTFRYASLDASRWIAGHNDTSHVYQYIQANFPGEELPALEAEYASKILREYKEFGPPDGTKEVDTLYRTVCEHFSVLDVSWIDEKTLRDWLELQFELHEFEIVPYSIKNPDGGLNTEISFRISAADATMAASHG